MTTTQQKSLTELCTEAQTMYQDTEDSPHGSIAFAVTASGDIRTVISSGDIYLSLRQAAFQLNPDDDYLGISVWGWAAPTSSDTPKQDDVPPSEHPERSRMHLVTITNRKGQSESRLHFIEQNHRRNNRRRGTQGCTREHVPHSKSTRMRRRASATQSSHGTR